MSAILRSQRRILRDNLIYGGLSLVPAVWMIVPFVLVVAQLQAHYGWTGLSPDQPALLKVHLGETWLEGYRAAGTNGSGKPDVHLELPPEFVQETPPVWIPSTGELVWRVRPQREGRFEATLELEGAKATKSIYVAQVAGSRSPSRQKPNVLHQLLYPAESSLPSSSPVQSISVEYPSRSLDLILGLKLHWLILYLILSIAFAFALRNRFGVTI